MSSQAKNEENSPPAPSPGRTAGPRLAPGPRVLTPARDPAGSRPRSLPTSTAGAPGPARRAHSLPTRNRNWPVGGTRAMASGRGQVGEGGTRQPLSRRSVGGLADPRGPRREGPAPRTPEPPPDTPRRRGGRPPRPGAESRLLHHSPPLLQESRRGDGEQLRAASRSFKDNNKKMATTQLLLRNPSPKVPPRPGRREAGGGGRLSSCVRGLGRPPRPSDQRHNSARRGRRGESPGARQARAPTARTHRVSGLRVHLAQVANHPNRFSWLRWAEARGSLALMAPRRRQRRRKRPAGSERRPGRSWPPLGLA